MNDGLTQFMGNLYQAGMSIDHVVQRGFDFAYKQEYETAYAARATPIYDTAIQMEASKAVLEAANTLLISLNCQQRISLERRW